MSDTYSTTFPPVYCCRCRMELKGPSITYIEGNPICSFCHAQAMQPQPVVIIGGYVPPDLSMRITELEATCQRLRELCGDMQSMLEAYIDGDTGFEQRLKDEGVLK